MSIKRTLYASIALLASYAGATAQTAIDEKTFPDEGFRAYVSHEFDKDANGLLSTEEIASAWRIDINGFASHSAKVETLKGIEVFGELRDLNCAGNALTALDLRANTNLEKVFCNGNALVSLDIEGLVWLKTLNCSKNSLPELDVTTNTRLRILDCSCNKIEALNVSNCADLNTLNCKKNALGAIDVSGNAALKQLSCSANRLTELNVGNNTRLTHLACAGNMLTQLDLSKNEDLLELDCHDNQLEGLDVSKNSKLTEIYCFGNKISALDVSENTALQTLSCGDNEIEELNVSNNKELRNLSCGVNKIKTLDTSNNKELEALNCNGNSIDKLDLAENTRLAEIKCEDNELTAIDLTANKELETATTDVQQVEKEVVSLPSGKSGFLLSEEAEEEAISDVRINGNAIESEAEIEVVEGQKYMVVDLSQQTEEGDIKLEYLYATGNTTARQGTGNRSLKMAIGSTWDGFDDAELPIAFTTSPSQTDGELKVRIEVTLKKASPAKSEECSAQALTARSQAEQQRDTQDIKNYRIQVVGSRIVVDGTDDYLLYDIIGRLMNPNSLLERGIYIVRIGDKSERVRAK